MRRPPGWERSRGSPSFPRESGPAATTPGPRHSAPRGGRPGRRDRLLVRAPASQSGPTGPDPARSRADGASICSRAARSRARRLDGRHACYSRKSTTGGGTRPSQSFEQVWSRAQAFEERRGCWGRRDEVPVRPGWLRAWRWRAVWPARGVRGAPTPSTARAGGRVSTGLRCSPRCSASAATRCDRRSGSPTSWQSWAQGIVRFAPYPGPPDAGRGGVV